MNAFTPIPTLVSRVRSAIEAGRMPATEAEYDTADSDYLTAKYELLVRLSQVTGLPIDEVRNLGEIL